MEQTRFGEPSEGSQANNSAESEQKPISEIEDPEERSLERLKRNFTPLAGGK